MKGLLYEKAVSNRLIEEYGFERYIPSQWFKYQPHGQRIAFCQTDGLLFTPREQKVLIVEIKYKHTADAYWQLENKYVPVIKWLFRDWTISTIEIVKWFSHDIPFPVPVSLKKDILQTAPSEFGVHIMNP